MALIPDDPKQRNALILGIIAAAGFYFFWSYWYAPIKVEVDEMSARLEQLESENNRAQIIATRGGTELQERLAAYEQHVVHLEALIPQSEEVCVVCHNDESPAWDPKRYKLSNGSTAGFDYEQAVAEILHPVPEGYDPSSDDPE